MSRTLKLATVQMDAAPAPTPDRLARAGALVARAAEAGAQLVVLPELFNVGYEYHDRNYGLAEPLTGPTMVWLKATAAEFGLHLAGSFMLLDGDEVFNSAFIVAPDGRTWRYDKIYPYVWERAYFREGRDITVAETDLGKLGLLICWDSGHPELWRRYAGLVDALVITSCPPNLHRADLVLPDGERARSTAFGVPIPDDVHFQDLTVNEQAGWLRVPVVASSGGGAFRSRMPVSLLSLLSLLGVSPALPRFWRAADEVMLESGYGPFAKIIDAQGHTLDCVETEGDGIAVAEVTLAETPPQPITPQPSPRMPASMRWALDWFGALLMIPQYRQGLRRQWGEQMAPMDPRTLVWAVIVLGAALIGYGVGRRK
jgi:predicted amidohydrolase